MSADAGKLPAIHSQQHQVQDDKIGSVFQRKCQPGLPIPRRSDIKSFHDRLRRRTRTMASSSSTINILSFMIFHLFSYYTISERLKPDIFPRAASARFTARLPGLFFRHYNVSMISHPTAPPIWVDTPLRLRQMVADISGYAHVAVDTESNSLYAYQEQVCLIQFSTGDRDYLVDPLSLPNLSSLQPFFESTQIEKIFHAAEYDLICLRRDFGFQVNHLFDTMQAARILGKKAFGLGSILSSELQVEIDKRYQRANWGAPSTPPAMLDYARLTHIT